MDLIKQLLVVDPEQRLSAFDALNHAWFKNISSGMPVKLDPAVLERLQSFRGVSKLRKAAMNMLVKMAD